MDNLRGIDSFIRAVQTGSIVAAARQQGISAAAASQNIARLEQTLGTRLLTRTTRRLALTEGGRVYYERVRTIMDDLDMAQAAVSALHERPQGRLRVASSAAFGRYAIAPMIASFCALYPDVAVELVLTDDKIDHIRDEIDLSIRLQHQLEPGLITRKLEAMPITICASPAYLERRGVPREPEELKNHDCLVFRAPLNGRLLPWGFVRNGTRFEPELHVSVISNDIESLARMTLAGAGITRLGHFISEQLIREGRLVALFQHEAGSSSAHADPEPLDFRICFRDRQAETPKVRAFIEHVVAEQAARVWQTLPT